MAAVRTSAVGSGQLADHGTAATAALYATDLTRKRARSEALAIGSQDQPSVLPAGLTLANATAAASLAHANQKSPTAWRPGKQPHAEKAAAFVRSYQHAEPVPAKQPNPDVYRAALLAARDRVYGGITSPATVTTPELKFDKAALDNIMSDKNSRAAQGKSTEPALQFSPGALTAATGAVSSNRRRTESAPTKPFFHLDSAAALTAATISHRASRDIRNDVLNDLEPSMEAARIHHIARTNAQMYTATPPVEIEVEEQRHKDTLRAAAISMAKDMYAISVAKDQSPIDETGMASAAAQNRLSRRYSQSQFSWVAGDDHTVIQRTPPNLHEAAQKIAAEKLAKMQLDDFHNKQEYYGTNVANVKNRQFLARRLRRRTSSEGDASNVDWQRSERIRHQMSSLQSRVNAIDEKRTKDRADLMEIARKNVNATIQGMDEEVYERTGKASPNIQREWEEKAQLRAQQESESRMKQFGRVAIGGDKYMDETEVEAIARSRVQPTLDEIDDRVQEQRAREVEGQLEQERRQRRLATDRDREAQLKAEEKKQEDGSHEKLEGSSANRRRFILGGGNIFFRSSRKLSGKKDVGAEKHAKLQEQPTATQTNDSATGHEETSPDATAAAPTTTTEPAQLHGDANPSSDPTHEQVVPEAADAETPTTPSTSSTSPKPASKIKSWFKGRLSRRLSKPPPPSSKEPRNQDNPSIAAEGVSAGDNNQHAGPLASHPVTDTDMISDLAPQRPEVDENNALNQEATSRQWSSSSEGSMDPQSHPGENVKRRKRGLRMSLRDMIARKPNSEGGSATGSPSASPTTASASSPGGNKSVGTAAMATTRPPLVPRLNTMERNELHDSFTEESLPPPPSLMQAEHKSLSSSARDSKFSEDL